MTLGPGVVQHVGSYLTDDGPVSESGRATLLPVSIAGADHTAVIEHAQRLLETVEGVDVPAGLQVTVAGPASFENEVIALAEEGLQKGESIGILVALVVVVLVSGAVVAGLIPIMLGVVAILTALGVAAVIGLAFDLSFIIAQIITMIGSLSASTTRCSSCPAIARNARTVSRRSTRSRAPVRQRARPCSSPV